MPDPNDEFTEALMRMGESYSMITATVAGVCKTMRDGGVPEEAISEFAVAMMRHLAKLLFGSTS